MKNFTRYTAASLALVVAGACTYDFPEEKQVTAGEADFTKTVVIGSSLSAGFMNGALYTDGQNASFPAIIAQQFKSVGGGDFNQPDINAAAGYYGLAPDGTTILGRLYLKGTTSPKPTPIVPGQAITPYTGDKSKLNNFSAYGVTIQTAQTPFLGGPSSGNPYYNPYYARFASTPGTSTLLGDAVAAIGNGSFFIFWLGNDDVLGYATNGADQNDATKPMTDAAVFAGAYNNAISTMLAANASAKGVVANIPDVTSLPYFSTVAYNPIPLDAASAAAVNAGFAGYNAVLDALKANLGITDTDSRKITFAAGTSNKIVIVDETLNDYGDEFDMLKAAGAISDAQRTALIPYEQVRQTTSTDLVPLTAANVIGTLVSNNPQLINGVTVPLADKYILLPSEKTEVQTRIDAFNSVIAGAVSTNSSRLALVDIHSILLSLKANGAEIKGATISASISPPFGGFSLDGIHPNARGNGYLANQFIDVINAKFGASVPQCNPNDYSGNALPVP
ncbi:MAG TPA: hypothetical protein VIN08_10185 [Ohtaekwangia sp.]|uniref:hypothetical protein n=1 Tax=Ohtaekwangia sp. TaxID=2066019 RepID=UPI002F94B631